MSSLLDLRLSRIRTLQQTYSAQQSDLPFLEERIQLLRDVIEDVRLSAELDGNPVLLARHHHDLGVSLHERFLHVHEVEDLKAAETHLRLAIHDLPPGTCFPGSASILGSVLCALIRELGDKEVAEESISLHRQALSELGSMPPLQKAHHSRELGRSLHEYHSAIKNDEEALCESITRLNDALVGYTEAAISDHTTLLALSDSRCSLFRVKHDESSLQDALSHATLALQICGPAHRDLFWGQWLLSRAQIGLAAFFEAEELLDQAVDTLRILRTDAPVVWKRMLADKFGEALRFRFMTHGREQDLEDLIECFTDILDGMDTHESQWDKLQWGLSIAFMFRFSIAGLPEDIEAAARAAHSAASAVKDDSVLLWDRLVQVAVCRNEQYVAFGDVAHLGESIALLERVVRQAPRLSLTWNVAGRNLLTALPQRYEQTGDVAHLDRAVELMPALTDDSNNRGFYAPLVLGCAGEVLLLRFQVGNAVEDLTQAIAFFGQAVEATDRASFRSNELVDGYATALRIHYEVFRDRDSATKALEIQNELIRAMPDTHPDYARALCHSARLQLSTDQSQPCTANALVTLLGALSAECCPGFKRLKEVSEVLTYLAGRHMPCLDRNNVLQLCTVYSTAIALLPQVASFGLEPRVRLSVITGAGSLTAQGAVHAISSGQLELALEMLESGRTVFWMQGLQLRTSFADLPQDIGCRLAKITYALARPIPDSASEGPSKERELARRRQLGEEFRSVVEEARLVPGCEDLLQNTPFASLARAAERNPIVVLVANGSAGYAVIIGQEAQCRLVVLSGATVKALEALSHRLERHSKQARSARGMRKVEASNSQTAGDVYRELWTLIMQPIVDVLQWPKSAGKHRRRLVLCPTGVFMQLPLHAAGIYTGNEQVCCSDYFVSSYTPSITALLHAQKSVKPVRRSEAETLLVAVGRPFQGTALPMTTKEAETVHARVSPSSKVVRVSNCREVLERIQSASIVHLACHGTQHISNPFQSSFHLEDDLLPVSKLMELELPSAFLAVLSACETAKGDAAQPDQAIHLAATMLFAGFKSVVATMWFMGDSEGPDVAEGIYSALFRQGAASEYLDPDDVPYALDTAVQKLRQSGLDPSFWATYVHLGI